MLAVLLVLKTVLVVVLTLYLVAYSLYETKLNRGVLLVCVFALVACYCHEILNYCLFLNASEYVFRKTMFSFETLAVSRVVIGMVVLLFTCIAKDSAPFTEKKNFRTAMESLMCISAIETWGLFVALPFC